MTKDDLMRHAVRELVLANRILAREEVIDDFGHVSLRHPVRPDRYLLARSRSPAARPDVMSVIHHHARPVIPFTVTKLALRPVFHMGSITGAAVPLWDSQPESGDTNMLVDDAAKGASLGRARSGRIAACCSRAMAPAMSGTAGAPPS